MAALLLAMLATRLPMVGAVLHLQDASWAVFFVAGFYLSAHWRWAFPVLMAAAVGIDYAAIRYLGISNYCVTLAYWFLVPSYACLWIGGHWLRKHLTMDMRGAALAVATLVIAVSSCFLISNGSFYWLGGRVGAPTWSGWMHNLGQWYWTFLRVSCVYVGMVALVHAIGVQVRQYARGRDRAGRGDRI